MRGTFLKGINAILEPTASKINRKDDIVFPLFKYNEMIKQDSLTATLSQYPRELQAILSKLSITEEEGLEMMQQIASNNAYAGSDGSVKDGMGGHVFCITGNSFTNQVWGHTQTVGIKSDVFTKDRTRRSSGHPVGDTCLTGKLPLFFSSPYSGHMDRQLGSGL